MLEFRLSEYRREESNSPGFPVFFLYHRYGHLPPARRKSLNSLFFLPELFGRSIPYETCRAALLIPAARPFLPVRENFFLIFSSSAFFYQEISPC